MLRMLQMNGSKGEMGGNDKDSPSHEERRHPRRETNRWK
jgi:hypothetical protein